MTEAFFPEVTIEPEVYYMVQSCSLLTNANQQNIKQHFLRVLASQGICQSQGDIICESADVSIRCGESRRTKRSAQQLSIKFKLKTEQRSVHNSPHCYQLCSNETNEACYADCIDEYLEQSHKALSVASDKLVSLFAGPPGSSPSRKAGGGSSAAGSLPPSYTVLNVGGLRLTPKDGIQTLAIRAECGEGKMLAENGVSCGKFFNSKFPHA